MDKRKLASLEWEPFEAPPVPPTVAGGHWSDAPPYDEWMCYICSKDGKWKSGDFYLCNSCYEEVKREDAG